MLDLQDMSALERRLSQRAPSMRLTRHASMADYTTLRLGGPADLMAEPADEAQLRVALESAADMGVPVTLMGRGSNLLVLDGGIRGLVIRLCGVMNSVEVDGCILRTGAGALLSSAALAAAEKGLAGLAFAGGIPGTVGGGIYMNAGAYGGELGQATERVEGLTMAGEPFAYTAEEIALNHLRHGIYPPESGYVANPYREMIGAAMRAAICGALAPGNPRMAAELAWRDGCVSHHNNGILAEVFNALIVSMAYVETDMQVILDKAMRMIPRDSEFYSVLAFACQACGQSRDYRQAWELCEEKYKEYNWVHAYPNLAAEVVAIRFAGNSFERAMTILMMAGQDNDCTGGPIGHAYGVMLGLDALDDKFVAPLRDQLDTYVRTMESQSITSLSKKTTDAILKYN